MNLLADLTQPTPALISDWARMVFYLAGLLASIGAAKYYFFPPAAGPVKPQPFQVSAMDPPVLESSFKRELRAIAEAQLSLGKNMDETSSAIDRHTADSAKYRVELEHSFALVRTDFAAADQKWSDKVFARMNEIDAETRKEIRAIPSEIIATLRNAGALKNT